MRTDGIGKQRYGDATMVDYAAAREAMVDGQVRPSDVTTFSIIAAMLSVPREDYVPQAMREVAYLGEHVPLAPGRVVLDPRVFAKLLDALRVGPRDLVLDVGCGLGYSTAVLARMAEAVIAVEADETLAHEAEAALVAHAVDNALVHHGPLTEGCAEHGPYDAIMLQGAIETLPTAYESQLKTGGRIVAIFVDGAHGQARIGTRTDAGIAWRRAFDATAPVLPGFVRAKAFEF
jgi:protein-L-isoaspartate(D-aspartate) O-methyltransferase